MDRQVQRNINIIRVLHLGFVVFGIAAWLSAEGAEEGGLSGYWLHAGLGFSLGFVMLMRVLGGAAGGAPLSFAGWSPLDPAQWRRAAEDVAGLLRLRIPHRPLHEGLAGLVQSLGIALFAGMALTGTLMFLLGEGREAYEIVEEIHEAGEGLIPAFLTVHAGAVLLHSLAGSPVWRKMFSRLPAAWQDPKADATR